MTRYKEGWNFILSIVIVVLVMVSGFAWLHDKLDDPTDGRTILCIGIIANTGNVARDDPFVIDACKEAGVDRADYPPTGG